jgi:hypothetical protein
MSVNEVFNLDFAGSDFCKKLIDWAVSQAPEAAKKGLFEALGELKHDADTIQPQTPYLEGHLRSDHKKNIDVNPDNITAQLVFLMPYAARMHEGKATWNWTRTVVPSPGPKFLEAKMMFFQKKYMNIVADEVKKTTGK